jgi:hypothetical protein
MTTETAADKIQIRMARLDSLFYALETELTNACGATKSEEARRACDLFYILWDESKAIAESITELTDAV